jgi:hypothetical protein
MARKPKHSVLRIRCTEGFKKGVELIAEVRDTSASALTRSALYEKFPELRTPEQIEVQPTMALPQPA